MERRNRWTWVKAKVKITQFNIILLDDGLVICLAGFELMSFHITSEGGYDGVRGSLISLQRLIIYCYYFAHELSANEGVLKLNIPPFALVFLFCVCVEHAYGAPCPSDY